jgi:perosamine synthetase
LARLRESVNAKAQLLTGGRPVHLYDLVQNRSAFPSSHYPFQSQDTGVDRSHPRGLCPVAEDAYSRWMTLELTENYSDQNVDEIAFAIAKVSYHLARHPTPTCSR